ncbi:hypothetical protein ARMSODRAFT_982856 [Armillaria solidipes]|uniref:Uncharacterized protein n=1 Tax=Armillaria solidipes TaxID=1076256 RepID=A0A2H3AL97_9AGAR|nr:hypothetical protein ARMSODRAFT_982856 [Armillaria solidipes]
MPLSTEIRERHPNGNSVSRSHLFSLILASTDPLLFAGESGTSLKAIIPQVSFFIDIMNFFNRNLPAMSSTMRDIVQLHYESVNDQSPHTLICGRKPINSTVRDNSREQGYRKDGAARGLRRPLGAVDMVLEIPVKDDPGITRRIAPAVTVDGNLKPGLDLDRNNGRRRRIFAAKENSGEGVAKITSKRLRHIDEDP